MAFPYYSPKPPGGRRRLVLEKGTYEVDVVGLSHRWTEVESLVGPPPEGEDGDRREVIVNLVRDPNNLHDGNAIAVWAQPHGHIGYLPRRFAADLASTIDRALAPTGEKVDIEAQATLTASWIGDDVEKVQITAHLTRATLRGSMEDPRPATDPPNGTTRGQVSTEVPGEFLAKIRRLTPLDLARVEGYVDALLGEAEPARRGS